MFTVKDKNGNRIAWNNGRFSSNNPELLKKIRERGKHLSQMGSGVSLEGTLLAAHVGVDFEKSEYTAYALLEQCMDIVDVKGHRPSILDLYPSEKDGENEKIVY